MDDGMQFWQLHKDVIICLLNACEPFDNGWVLPRGLLREPISHLRRAQMVVLTNSRRAGSERVRALRERVLQIAPNVSVFVGDLQARSLRSLDSTVRYEVDWLAKRRVFTFAALGNPTSFEHTVKELGAEIVERVQLADHQAFSRERLAEISDRAATLDIDALITTEKDAIKLPMVEMATPVFVLEVEMVLEESEAFWGALEGRLCGTLLGDDNSDS
jgi:tetraacyldisaccharide 4'-kinase